MGFITGYSRQQRREIRESKEIYENIKINWINKLVENGFSWKESNGVFEKYTIHNHPSYSFCSSYCQPKDTFLSILNTELPLKKMSEENEMKLKQQQIEADKKYKQDLEMQQKNFQNYESSVAQKIKQMKETASSGKAQNIVVETPKEVIVDQQVEVEQSTSVIETIEEQDLQIQLLELEQKQLLIEKQIVELKLKKQQIEKELKNIEQEI